MEAFLSEGFDRFMKITDTRISIMPKDPGSNHREEIQLFSWSNFIGLFESVQLDLNLRLYYHAYIIYIYRTIYIMPYIIPSQLTCKSSNVNGVVKEPSS